MPSVATIINKFGKIAGWNSVKLNMLGRDVEGIRAIKYDDSLEIEGVKGAGDEDIGYADGNYKATAEITLLLEEINAIQSMLVPGAHLSSIAPFDILVVYQYGGKKVKDRIRNCVIIGRGIDVKQGDKVVGTTLKLYTPKIVWNDI
jgi:hypothetical protein